MRSRLLLLLLLAFAAGSVCSQGVVNQSLLRASDARAVSTWTTNTFEAVQASVVYVAIEVDGPRGKFVIERASSGLIVDSQGLVLTFYALVRETVGAADKRLFVQLNDAGNTQLDAEVLAHDEASGLALLKVTPPADGLHQAKLGSDRPRIGEPVMVISRPEGKEMLAFAGVASPSLAPANLGGKLFAAAEVFLADSRNDERCDGGSVFGADGCMLGLYSTEHVKRDVQDPKLEDLKKPSFGVVVSAGRIRAAFAQQFADATNATLARAPRRATHAWAKAAAMVAPSVVGVFGGEGDWPTVDGSDPGCTQRRARLGSGVVLSRTGLVVTNAHLLRSADDLRVKVGGKLYGAEIVKRRVSSNLALLQVDLPAGDALPAAACAQNDDVQLGEAILAVGNPLGAEVVVSAGVVSALRAREGGRIQADANLGNQNGGGAIVNAAGRVVGIADAGSIDPIEMAYQMRGDSVQQETNLSTFVGIRQVRKLFRSALEEGADGDESIVAPVDATESQRQMRKAALCEMVQKTSGALLNIYVARNMAIADPDDPFPPEPSWQTMSLGSGVIIDRTGLAVSNWHVVDAGTNPDGSSIDDFRITARVFGGKEYEVQVLSISREDDLSLIQLVLDPGEEVNAVELGSSENLAIGEAVAAIGNPHGRANTITYGVVSAKGQGLRIKGRWAKLKHLIETDAAINGGNSGGALLDMNGRLVGINSAGGGTFNNVGYAIAVDHVREQITGLLMQSYKLRSVDLGMRILDDDGKVLVMDVDGRGPAALAGVQSGDQIRAFAGNPITWGPGFARVLMEQQAGAELELEVERAGVVKMLKIKPVAPEAWSLIRQSGVRARDFSYVEDPERVRLASIAMHRAFTGDVTAEPRQIAAQVVEVERVFEQDQGNPGLRPGDLLLAIELPTAAGRPALEPIASVARLRDWFNDRTAGKVRGVDHYKFAAEYPVWVARGKDVKKITLRAKRLLW